MKDDTNSGETVMSAALESAAVIAPTVEQGKGTEQATVWPVDAPPIPSATDDKGITVLPCILSRPKNPNVFEKFGRKSTIAVDVQLPIIMANGVTIQIPGALWGRLTAGEQGLKTVFDFSVSKGIGIDDDNKLLTNAVKKQIGEWEGWALAASEAHRRLTTVKVKAATVDLDYTPPPVKGLGIAAPILHKRR